MLFRSTQVFLRPFPNVGGDRVQVSIDSADRPMWADNSRAIFYSAEGGVFRVDVAPNAQLSRPVLVLPMGPLEAPLELDQVARALERVGLSERVVAERERWQRLDALVAIPWRQADALEGAA